MFKELFKKKTLSDRLKGEAISLGLCQQWQGEWRDNSTRDELAEKFIRGIDFATKHNWPSPEFIKKNFDPEFRRRWGVYIDEEVAITSQHTEPSVLVFLGKNEGTLEFDGFGSKDIYVRHQGKLRIVAAGKSIVRVTTYDDVEIDAEAVDDARIFIYHHGGKVRMSGRVAYREREQAKC